MLTTEERQRGRARDEAPDDASGSGRSIQALAKVGDVLAALAESGPLSASAIAERVNEPRSSIYRLLRTLRDLEYVDSKRRGEFELGIRVFQLGAAVASRFSIRNAVLPVMKRLHDETEGTILLFVPRGDAAACVERIDGRWVRLEIVDVGETLPLHTGAAPRTLLAYSDAEFVDAYLDRTRLEQHTRFSPATPREVRALLADVTAAGYAISNQDLVLGVASIAAPIRDDSGTVIGALSYSGMASVLLAPAERERSIRLVAEGAGEASRQLGYAG